MKKFFSFTIIILFLLVQGVVYGTYRQYQMVDVYVCESSLMLAEMTARVSVNRKELYRVSRCRCDGVHSSMKSEVKGMSCDPPKSNVYNCLCSGTSSY